jgi:hypothetical protein
MMWMAKRSHFVSIIVREKFEEKLDKLFIARVEHEWNNDFIGMIGGTLKTSSAIDQTVHTRCHYARTKL